MESMSGRMDASTLGNTHKTRNMGMAHTNSQMGVSSKGSGRMGCKMVSGLWSTKTGKVAGKGSGPKVSMSDGLNELIYFIFLHS